jgi:hypothetical protein
MICDVLIVWHRLDIIEFIGSTICKCSGMRHIVISARNWISWPNLAFCSFPGSPNCGWINARRSGRHLKGRSRVASVFWSELPAPTVWRVRGPAGMFRFQPDELEHPARVKAANELDEMVVRRAAFAELRRFRNLQMQRDELRVRDIAGIQGSGDRV